jgi:hypothetical protein
MRARQFFHSVCETISSKAGSNIFDTISVAEREDLLLQQKFLPSKYRSHLVELGGEGVLFSNKKRDLWPQKG